MSKYFDAHPGDESKAILHYQCNIKVSRAFYPLLSTLEVALRNSVNRELIEKFDTPHWYNFLNEIPKLAQLQKSIDTAINQITHRHEEITAPKMVAELTLGFWVSLFNTRYDDVLWKDLRRAFPYLPKKLRQRHKVSAPLNNFRNLRNRIFIMSRYVGTWAGCKVFTMNF